MAVAKGAVPADFEHEFYVTTPAPSLMEEIMRRTSSSDSFSEACLIDSAYGIADAMAYLQSVEASAGAISTASLVFQGDYIKFTSGKVQQGDRFKSPLEMLHQPHNSYKSQVFSLGVALLEAALLTQVNGLNVAGCLSSKIHAEIYDTVMGLNCEKVLKCLLLICLKHDESVRPDWQNLLQMIKCEGFNLTNYQPVNEAFLLNERTYASSTPNPRDQSRDAFNRAAIDNENLPIEEMSMQSVDEPSMIEYVPVVLPVKKVTVVTKVQKRY